MHARQSMNMGQRSLTPCSSRRIPEDLSCRSSAWLRFGRIRTKHRRIGAKFGRASDQNSGQIVSIPGRRLRPDSVDSAPDRSKSAKFGPISGLIWAELGRSRPGFGRTRPQSGQSCPDFDRFRTDMGRTRPGIGQSWPDDRLGGPISAKLRMFSARGRLGGATVAEVLRCNGQPVALCDGMLPPLASLKLLSVGGGRTDSFLRGRGAA